jgi:hypothetical protein
MPRLTLMLGGGLGGLGDGGGGGEGGEGGGGEGGGAHAKLSRLYLHPDEVLVGPVVPML